MGPLLAAQIPDGLVWGMVPIIFSAVFGWGAWITLSTARTDSASKANTAAIEDHERRLRTLEGTKR